jgi:photosystem II stability/assembly factor-like uncharacterized protein
MNAGLKPARQLRIADMKKSIYLTSLLIIQFISFTCKAQETVPDLFKNMSMRSIGPAVMSGRVTAIDVAGHDENIIFTGTASGGLWKSESGGITWQPVFDKQEIMGIGSVRIDPSSPDIVWAGTGEGNPRNSQTSGGGIFKSNDGGQNWKKSGLEKTTTIHRIIVDPSNSEVVYAGAHGSAWGPTPDRGVYKTSDGGNTWTKILFVNDTVGCSDLVMDPLNPGKLFAAMYQYERKPFVFKSGGKGSGLYMTTDGGKKWTQLTDKHGLPEGELGRIGIAIAPSNPRIVYALIESKKTALYKSMDGGFNWKKVNDEEVSDRPFYYHELYVDPSNENHIIYLHSTVSESIDGGKTWTTLLPYYGVHPDHHAFWWSKKNPTLMYEGNDGGLNFSRDGGKNWTFVSNLPLGQFYHVDHDMEVPYNVYGGMQDNGSWKGPAYVWHYGGIRAEDWRELLFGDGFDVVPQKNNARYVYAMSQGGEVNYIDTETGNMQYIKPVHPEGTALRFNWNAGIAQDPFQDRSVYFGSQFLHHSNDNGLTWTIISPDLTSNDPNKIKQKESGGLTPDQTGAEMHCTIISIAPSTHSEKMIWVGTDDGNVQMTADGGKSWSNTSAAMPGLPKGAWIPQIQLSKHNESEAFVVVNNYRQNDWRPFLFHTRDAGKTWKNLASTDQISGHCLSMVQDPVTPSLLFVGTENGLYISFDYGNKWMKWTHDYPSVATQDLKIHPMEHDLIIGTFGRAIYILDDIRPLRAYALDQNHFNKKLVAMPTPVAWQSSMMQPAGERFPADHHYTGQNKEYGARLGYAFQFDTDKKTESTSQAGDSSKKKKNEKSNKTETKEIKKAISEKSDKVKISIHDMNGDTIRTWTHEPDTGFNYLLWRFDTKGVRYPTQNEEKEKSEEPGGGINAPPGTYKVVYALDTFKDSTTFEVKYDPRLGWNAQAYDAQKALYARYTQIVQRAKKGTDNLQTARKNIEMAKTAWTNVPDSLKKDILTQADSLNGKIDDLFLLYFNKPGTRGYVDSSDKLSSTLYSVSSYLENPITGVNAQDAMTIAEKLTKEVIEKIDSFIQTDLMPWQEKASKLQFNLFREFEK